MPIFTMAYIAMDHTLFFVNCNAVQHTDRDAVEPREGFLVLMATDMSSRIRILDSNRDHQAEHVALALCIKSAICQDDLVGHWTLPHGVAFLGKVPADKVDRFEQLAPDIPSEPGTCKGTFFKMWFRIADAITAKIVPVSVLLALMDVMYCPCSTFAPVEVGRARRRGRETPDWLVVFEEGAWVDS